jgi:cytidine deaminase
MLRNFSFSFNSYDSVDDLSINDKSLIKAAEKSLEKAYSVYSGFSVGASLLLENGELITANNQENSAFPSSMCAERVLLYYCRATFPKLKIKKIAITVKSIHGKIQTPISPCGSCRQVMSEYEKLQNHPIEILLKGEQGSVYVINCVEDLLPLSFKPNVIKYD